MTTRILQRSKEFIITHPLLSILTFSVVVRLVRLFLLQELWWDTHIYIGMAKFIASSGQTGIYESFRPPLHPLLLSLFEYLKFPLLTTGKVLDLILSIIVIAQLYYLTKKLFNKKTAVLASLIFSLTPIFTHHTGFVLTEPLALVLTLLALQILLKENPSHFAAGLTAALAFLTKFPQGILLPVFIIFIIHKTYKKQPTFTTTFQTAIFPLVKFITGFLIPTLPYLYFNYIQYQNPFFPFIEGSKIITTSTFAYAQGHFFYFTTFLSENPLFIFSFVYLLYFIKNKLYRQPLHLLLTLLFILTISYFSFVVPRKELRYLTTLLPILAILASVAIFKLYEYFQRTKYLRPKSFLVLIAIFLTINISAAVPLDQDFNPGPIFLTLTQKNNLTGLILSSDPSPITYTQNPTKILLSGLQYGPDIYQQYQKKYSLLYINSCHFQCAQNDQPCQKEKEKFLSTINRENNIIVQSSKSFKEQTCVYTFYEPK